MNERGVLSEGLTDAAPLGDSVWLCCGGSVWKCPALNAAAGAAGEEVSLFVLISACLSPVSSFARGGV